MKKPELVEKLKLLNGSDIYYLLYLDSTTGVLNRLAYEHSSILNAKSIVIIDLDGLKYINDNFGHRAGDQKLKELCTIIKSQSIFNEEDFYRLSGDEFLGISYTKEPGQIIEEINKIRITPHWNYFSFGLGDTLDEADIDLRYDKKRREISGERAERGECPPWISY